MTQKIRVRKMPAIRGDPCMSICGGGVIGACTASSARRGIGVTVVERTDIAAAASGKRRFLALDGAAARRRDHWHGGALAA